MTLRAIDRSGAVIQSPEVDPATFNEWRGLEARGRRRAGITFLCVTCATDLNPKRSPNGFPFLAHKPKASGCVEAAGESDEHMDLKGRIAAGVDATKGWRAQTECEFGDGLIRVDVAAFRRSTATAAAPLQLEDGELWTPDNTNARTVDEKPWGWEAQLSPLGYDRTLTRHEERQGFLDRGVWVWDHKSAALGTVPGFRVDPDKRQYVMSAIYERPHVRMKDTSLAKVIPLLQSGTYPWVEDFYGEGAGAFIRAGSWTESPVSKTRRRASQQTEYGESADCDRAPAIAPAPSTHAVEALAVSSVKPQPDTDESPGGNRPRPCVECGGHTTERVYVFGKFGRIDFLDAHYRCVSDARQRQHDVLIAGGPCRICGGFTRNREAQELVHFECHVKARYARTGAA